MPTYAISTVAAPMPNLENLRKQAKLILRWHRDRYYPVAATYGEPPFYAQVKRDGARLNLKCVDRPVIDPVLRDREQLLSAALLVATAEEIKALFLEFETTGVAFFQKLKREPWGARNFI